MGVKNRKRVIISVIVVVIILIFVGIRAGDFAVNHSKTISYVNPVGGITNIGDPFVMKDGGDYYLYATSDSSFGFKVWQSLNLTEWQEKGHAYYSSDQKKPWGTGDFWAPEVVKHDGQYVMVYSARNIEGHLQISIAKSVSPLGPFQDVSTQIIKQEGSYIDGDIFIDEDGTPYLYYVKDCSENIIDGQHVSQIYVQKMNDDLTEVLGEPKLLLTPDQDWEGLGGDYQWNEGPFLLKHQGKYYMMYSANYYADANYSIGYAVSDHPMGPFEKSLDNPVLSKDLTHGISGPGHNSVTLGPDGKTLYMVYHTHTDPKTPSGDRQVNIDRLYFDGGKLRVDGPTYTEQQIRVSP